MVFCVTETLAEHVSFLLESSWISPYGGGLPEVLAKQLDPIPFGDTHYQHNVPKWFTDGGYKSSTDTFSPKEPLEKVFTQLYVFTSYEYFHNPESPVRICLKCKYLSV